MSRPRSLRIGCRLMRTTLGLFRIITKMTENTNVKGVYIKMLSLNLKRGVVLTSLTMALALLGGCASKGGSDSSAAPETAAPTGPNLLKSGKTINSFTVSAADTLAEDVAAAADQFSVANKIENEVKRNNELGAGTLEVDVKVVSMRLRSVGNAIALGLMSGVDWIAVKVTVSEDGAVVKEFEEKSSNSFGGLGYGGREKRVDRMVRDLGKRIIRSI